MKKDVNPSNFEQIPTFAEGGKPVVNVVVETPRNQRHKYAFFPKYGLFCQKMLLPDGLLWPYDYGFIPQTFGDDGDPLDLLFLGDEPTFAGCLVEAHVIGIVKLKKNGVENDRILARPRRQPGLTRESDAFDDVGDVPKDTIRNICRYLVEYSASEGNKIEFLGTKSRKRAMRAINDGMKAFKKSRK